MTQLRVAEAAHAATPRPMRVGLLTTSYPRFEGDMAGIFVRGFAQALRGRGHRVDVLAPSDGKRPPFDATPVRYLPHRLQRTFYGDGVPDNVRHAGAWPGLVTFPPALLAATLRRRSQWDAVISHFALPCALVGAAIAEHRPHLAVWHGGDVALASRLPMLLDALRRTPTRHWCVSEHARQQLRLPNAIVAPMGASVSRFARDHARRIVKVGDETTALFVGRLVPLKGVDLALVASQGLGLSWIIAGDGPERARLEALAKRLGVSARFVGRVTPEVRDAWLSAADVFVAPSRAVGRRVEGAPVALLEAPLAGLPCIVSDSGGLAERVRDGEDGLVVKAGDVDDLRVALRGFLRGTMRGFGSRARANNARYRWEELAPRIENALQGSP